MNKQVTKSQSGCTHQQAQGSVYANERASRSKSMGTTTMTSGVGTTKGGRT